MSYLGKKYDRVKTENMEVVVEKLNLGPRLAAVIKRGGTISYYENNADGSIQYIVKMGDDIVTNQKIEHNKETEFQDPDGKSVKSVSTIDGDVVKSIFTRPDGTKVNFDRYFEGDKMRIEVSVPALGVKGVIYYEAI